MLWINDRWYYRGGNIENIIFEIELGERAAFDLYCLDDTMFCSECSV